MSSGSGFTIKRANMNDLETQHDFLEMQEVCFPDDYCMAPHQDDTVLWWFVRDEDGDPVGFACLTEGHTDKRVGYLAWAGVMPEARGYGLQRKLIRVRLDAAAKRGYERALTYTRTINSISSNNLITCGFKLHRPSLLYADPKGKWDEGVLYWQRKPLRMTP